MGTRGFIGIRDAQRTVATYNHFDSYPTGLGTLAAEFVRTADMAQVAELFAKVQLVQESDEPTPEEQEKYSQFFQNVSSGADWYSYLRDLHGNLMGYLEAGIIPVWDLTKPDEPLRSTDSWLEYGYLVDLTTETLRVYDIDSGKPPRQVAEYPFAELRELGSEEDVVHLMEGLERVLNGGD
jgi:hypothetical protein